MKQNGQEWENDDSDFLQALYSNNNNNNMIIKKLGQFFFYTLLATHRSFASYKYFKKLISEV